MVHSLLRHAGFPDRSSVLDGCTRSQQLTKVSGRWRAPGIVTAGLLVAVSSGTRSTWAQPDHQPDGDLPVFMARFREQLGSSRAAVGVVTISVLPQCFWVLTQKSLVRASHGAVKG
jgi:hypothetical protein